VTKEDRIVNKLVENNIGVGSIEDKTREKELR